MTTINTDRFTAIKSRLKTEVQRRQYVGSVSSYGGTAYDFTNSPKQGASIDQEHYNKIIEPLNAVNPEGIPNMVQNGTPIENQLDVFDAKLTVFESKPLTAASNNTGCAASCTGLCSTGCYGTCTGTCTGTCSGSCTGSCKGCTSCSGSCSDYCTGCDGCSGCGGSCSYGCSGSCTANCASWYCSGCSGSCSALCADYCGPIT